MSTSTVTESITGISFLTPEPTAGRSAAINVLERIASCSAGHLRQGGCLDEAEAQDMLTGYRAQLHGPNPGPPVRRDFLAFTAMQQTQRHSVTMEGEVLRMQKLLRHRLHDQVHYWSLGPLPGKSSSLYEHCPPLHVACELLGCPAVLAGETSIVHVAALNPVAALVAAAWIRHEMQDSGLEAPFIFPFIVDLPTWDALQHRHFAT